MSLNINDFKNCRYIEWIMNISCWASHSRQADFYISLEFRAPIEFACGYTDTIKEDHRLVSLLKNNHSTKSHTNTDQYSNSPWVLTAPNFKELALSWSALESNFTVKQNCFLKKSESEGQRVIMVTESRDKYKDWAWSEGLINFNRTTPWDQQKIRVGCSFEILKTLWKGLAEACKNNQQYIPRILESSIGLCSLAFYKASERQIVTKALRHLYCRKGAKNWERKY